MADERDDQVCIEHPLEQRRLVERLARDRRQQDRLHRVLLDDPAVSGRRDRGDRVVEAVVEQLERGRLSLWVTVPEREFELVAEPVGEPLDALGEFTDDAANDEPAEDPLHVLVRIAYDPQRPEAWDDRLRLFSTDDEGGTYDQEVDLASEAQTQRDDQDLLVLFRDVVPDREYSCFLDLGGQEGGYLVFHHHRVGLGHRVAGLPRDAA